MEELAEQESIDSDRYNYNHLPDDRRKYRTRAIPWWKCKGLDKELKRRKEDDEGGEVKGADYQNSDLQVQALLGTRASFLTIQAA